MLNQGGVMGRNLDDAEPEMQTNYYYFLLQQYDEKRQALEDKRQKKAQRNTAQKIGHGIRGLFTKKQEHPPYDKDFQLAGAAAYGYHYDPNPYIPTEAEAAAKYNMPVQPPPNSRVRERYGPVGWEQFYPQWNAIGKDYEKSCLNAEQKKYLEKRGIIFRKQLGKGGFGEVWSVKRTVKGQPGKQTLACKVMSIKMYDQLYSVKEAVAKLLLESEVMKGLNHPNCVIQSDVLQIEDQITGFPFCFIFQFMELCDGSLFDMHWQLPGKKMDESEAKHWFIDISNGLKYLHDQHISHLDIKPDNILYKMDLTAPRSQVIVYKLTDFGLSIKFEALVPNVSYKAQGTPIYMAPEIRSGPYETKPADIYSLGLTLISSVVNINREPIPLLRAMNQGGAMAAQYRLDNHCLDLIINMCRTDPQQRWTIDQVLGSQWVNSP